MNTVIDKTLVLNEIKNHFGFKKNKEFADFLGVKPQTLSSWYSRNTFDIELLYAKCRGIFDPHWILTTEGNKLISKNGVKNDFGSRHLPSNESSNPPNEIIKQKQGIPLIPIEAMAGWGIGDLQVMNYQTNEYRIPEFDELNVDFMIRVKGSSMYPKYNSGDMVACKKLTMGTFFQWNKVYVLSTSQGAIIKRVNKSDNPNTILCVSDNPSYPPFELSVDEIYSLAIVVGVIRLE